MDKIGNDVLKQALVMSDDQLGIVGPLELIDAYSDDAKSVDIEAGIRLIENGELRFQDGHLENFVLLFLAAGEAFVDGALQEIYEPVEHHHFVFYHCKQLENV